MSYDVKILPKAYNDAVEARKWYNGKRTGFGNEFKIEVNKEIEYIRNNPKHFQRKYKTLRQSIVPRFPYLIFFILLEEKKQIVILGILHAKRSPDFIQKRLNM